MASVSSAGIGSGLDVEGIITKLMSVEKQPLTKLTDAATVLNSKVTAFGQIKSQISSLSDAANALTAASLWVGKSVLLLSLVPCNNKPVTESKSCSRVRCTAHSQIVLASIIMELRHLRFIPKLTAHHNCTWTEQV